MSMNLQKCFTKSYRFLVYVHGYSYVRLSLLITSVGETANFQLITCRYYKRQKTLASNPYCKILASAQCYLLFSIQ